MVVRGTQLWLHEHTPDWLRARVHAAFLDVLCILSGLAMLFGPVHTSSVNTVLPLWAVKTWGASLIIGPGAHLWGLSSIRLVDGSECIRRPAVYKLGLRVCVAAGSVYLAAIIQAGALARGPLAVALVAAWVLTNVVRLNEVSVAEYRAAHPEDPGPLR